MCPPPRPPWGGSSTTSTRRTPGALTTTTSCSPNTGRCTTTFLAAAPPPTMCCTACGSAGTRQPLLRVKQRPDALAGPSWDAFPAPLLAQGVDHVEAAPGLLLRFGVPHLGLAIRLGKVVPDLDHEPGL